MKGAKLDLEEHRTVSREEGQELADSNPPSLIFRVKEVLNFPKIGWNATFLETSAKTGKNIKEAFYLLASQVTG